MKSHISLDALATINLPHFVAWQTINLPLYYPLPTRIKQDAILSFVNDQQAALSLAYNQPTEFLFFANNQQAALSSFAKNNQPAKSAAALFALCQQSTSHAFILCRESTCCAFCPVPTA
jgi:hypothetical protein